MSQVLRAAGLVLMVGGMALAQPTVMNSRRAMEGTLQAGLSGRWWTNPTIANRLGLTPDQQKKMDAIFQQERLKLIDLTAALDKEEAMLEPLMESDQPDVASIRTQIDRIVQARSELEKVNANMLLGIRLILTPSQWEDLRVTGNGPRPAPVQGRGADQSGTLPSGSSPVPRKPQ